MVTRVADADEEVYRGYHSTATLLPDGRVLIAGADGEDSAQIYSPAYLFNGARPSVTSAPSAVRHGETFFVETPDAASIADAMWVVPGSTTHSQNWTQRANHLEFTEVAGGLEITVPSNPNEAPPGYYMLFLINDNGVPSVAEWLPLLVPLRSDLTSDGFVDFEDLTILLANWNQDGPTPGNLVNADTTPVNFEDLSALLADWTGPGPAGSPEAALGTEAVPEPSSLLLALCATLGLGFYRGRRRRSF